MYSTAISYKEHDLHIRVVPPVSVWPLLWAISLNNKFENILYKYQKSDLKNIQSSQWKSFSVLKVIHLLIYIYILQLFKPFK